MFTLYFPQRHPVAALTPSSSSPTHPCIQWVLGISRPWRDGNNSPPSNAEVENKWSYASAPPICLLGVDSNNFTFSFNPHSLYPSLRVKDQFLHPCKIMKRSTKFMVIFHFLGKTKGKVHRCTGTEALYRPYGP